MKLLCSGRRSYKSAFLFECVSVVGREKEVATLIFFFFLSTPTESVRGGGGKKNEGHPRSLERLVSMHDTGSIASPTWNCRTPLLVPRHCQFGHSKTKLLRRFAAVSPFCFGYPAQPDIAS